MSRVLPQGIHPHPGLSELHTWGPQHPKWTLSAPSLSTQMEAQLQRASSWTSSRTTWGADYSQKVGWHLISQSKWGWLELMFNRDS